MKQPTCGRVLRDLDLTVLQPSLTSQPADDARPFGSHHSSTVGLFCNPKYKQQDRTERINWKEDKQSREYTHSLDARQWHLSPGKQPWGCASAEKHWQLHQPQVREPLRLTLKAPHRNLYVWHCCLFVISLESKMCLCKTHVCCHYRSDLNKPCQSKDGRNSTELLAACLLSFHMLI